MRLLPVTQQEAQQADAQLQVLLAALDREKAGVDSARLQVTILEADHKKAESARDRTHAALAAAKLNFSYTRITTPIDGKVSHRSLRQVAFVTTGTPLLAFIYRSQFRKPQLANIHPGQTITIHIDSQPGVILSERVASLVSASGASFAPVAPQNATGNFTKVVQRLPVRISITPGQAASKQLRVRMSVQPTIEICGDS